MYRRRMLCWAGSAASLALAGCTAGIAGQNLSEVARGAGLGRFLAAMREAGLAPLLQGSADLTIFAPSEAAFAAAAPQLSRFGREPGALRGLLGYHIVQGVLDASFLSGRRVNYRTTSAASLDVDGTGGGLRVDGARVLIPDLRAANGVIHVIDRVLSP